MGFFVIYLILYLPLLIIGIIFLFKALKRKNRIQIAIFSACVIFCGYSIVAGLAADISIKKKDREYDKAALHTLPVGDTATMEGRISFSKTDPYDRQDSLNRTEGFYDSLNRIYLVRSVKYDNITREEFTIIKLSAAKYTSLKEYLNYGQQMRENISYHLKIKVKKIEEDFPGRWLLFEIIKIAKLNKPPDPL
jgi:hypothetical protein